MIVLICHLDTMVLSIEIWRQTSLPAGGVLF